MAEKQTRRKAKALLTISEACQVMGVSEAALRQWTDEGKVKAFVTPGGHRRYFEDELKALVQGHRRVHGLRDLSDRLEGVAPREREVAVQHMQSTGWYKQLDDETKLRLRERGRRLVGVLARFANRPATLGQAADECRAIGQEYGEDLARAGLSLMDALEAFMRHRSPVYEATNELLSNNAPVNRRAAAAIPQVGWLIDQTLLALVETHQRMAASSPVSEREAGQ